MAPSLHILVPLIVLYGFESLYLHVPVCMVQKRSHVGEICTSQRRVAVNFLQSKDPK